jgi:hypothetical protein
VLAQRPAVIIAKAGAEMAGGEKRRRYRHAPRIAPMTVNATAK